MISVSNAPAAGKKRVVIIAISAFIILTVAFLHYSYATHQQIQDVKSFFGAETDNQDVEEGTDDAHIEYVNENDETRPINPTSLLPSPSSMTSTPSTSNEKPAQAAATQIGAVIAAARGSTDVTWMDELQKDSWKPYPYNVDDRSPQAHLAIPANKGHEAMVYLSWLIDNYDQLPEYSVFTHGHRTSWHQEGDMVELISSIRLPALKDAGYISLRCDWYPSCPREIRPIAHDVIVWGPGVNREATEYEISRAWNELFPNEPLPETIASQCCAQFAVTKEAIHRRRKEDYERIRQWILDTQLPDDVSGRVLEKLWAYIFTGEAIRCPAPQRCACEYFGQCEPKTWPQTPEGLPDIPSW